MVWALTRCSLLITFSATSRFIRRCRALYTTPMPPWPSLLRISYPATVAVCTARLVQLPGDGAGRRPSPWSLVLPDRVLWEADVSARVAIAAAPWRVSASGAPSPVGVRRPARREGAAGAAAAGWRLRFTRSWLLIRASRTGKLNGLVT